jgi:hypothetical protein
MELVQGKESAGKSDASSDRNDVRRFGGSSMIGTPRCAARLIGQIVRGFTTMKLEKLEPLKSWISS